MSKHLIFCICQLLVNMGTYKCISFKAKFFQTDNLLINFLLTWVPTWRELHVQFSSDITFFLKKKKKLYKSDCVYQWISRRKNAIKKNRTHASEILAWMVKLWYENLWALICKSHKMYGFISSYLWVISWLISFVKWCWY